MVFLFFERSRRNLVRIIKESKPAEFFLQRTVLYFKYLSHYCETHLEVFIKQYKSYALLFSPNSQIEPLIPSVMMFGGWAMGGNLVMRIVRVKVP